MAASRKKKAAAPRKHAGRRHRAAPPPPESTAPRECWLCTKPLTDAVTTTSMLGQGVFEVHRRCYEESLGIKRGI